MKKKHDMLVLNRNFVPIHIVAWRDGISLVYKDAAHALNREFHNFVFNDWVAYSQKEANLEEEYSFIQTARGPIAIPEIIVLTQFDRLPDRNVKYSRENMIKRDKYTCQYCGEVFPYKMLTVDHVLPQDQGGKSIWSNVVTACKPCNNFKANRTPIEAGMRLIRRPIKPRWISPITQIESKEHPCKSWLHFTKRVDGELDMNE